MVEYANIAANAAGGFNRETSILYNTEYDTGDTNLTTWSQGSTSHGEWALNLSTNLARNGSTNGTYTLSLGSGSLAIDAIPYADAGSGIWNGSPTTGGNYFDQRGTETVAGVPISIGAYNGNPTVVELTAFTARGFGDHVVITWETASEIDTAGFYLWRRDGSSGEYIQITPTLISAKGSVTSGAAYTYTDTDVTPSRVYHYKLTEVSTSGARNDYGPVSAAVGDAVATEVTGSGTIDDTDTADGIGAITLEGNGTYLVTTGRYEGSPKGTPSFTGTGDYWFVDLNNALNLTRMTISFYPASSGDTLYYWDGDEWIPCSQQEYHDGYLEVTLTGDTLPAISDFGTVVFALGRETASIPTLGQWGVVALTLLLGVLGASKSRRKRTFA